MRLYLGIMHFSVYANKKISHHHIVFPVFQPCRTFEENFMEKECGYGRIKGESAQDDIREVQNEEAEFLRDKIEDLYGKYA